MIVNYERRHLGRFVFILVLVNAWPLTPRRGAKRSPVRISTLEEELTVAQSPVKNIWVDNYDCQTSTPFVSTSSVKVVSWNVLGPIHGEGIKHAYASKNVRLWSRRRERILDDLQTLNADIFCLQEVSAKALKETFIPRLKQLGLECCAYAQGKEGSGAGRGRYAHRHIGCAIFVRTSKLRLLVSKRVYLRDFCQIARCQSEPFLAVIRERWNPLAMVALRVVENNATLLVGNTHLHWDPRRPDIKAAQSHAVLQALEAFVATCAATTNSGHVTVVPSSAAPEQNTLTPSETILPPASSSSSSSHPPPAAPIPLSRSLPVPPSLPPLILCGDFNVMAEFDIGTPTALFELYTTGTLSTAHPEHPDKFSTGDPSPRIGTLNTPWRLRNTYQAPGWERFQPLFTTKTDDFQGWIDHIWVTEGVTLQMLLQPPIITSDLSANQKARKFPPIPAKGFPSDHLPIGIIASIAPGNSCGLFPTDSSSQTVSSSARVGLIPLEPLDPLGGVNMDLDTTDRGDSEE